LVKVLRRSDILISVILGEIVALFLILISKSLERDIPVLDVFIRSRWLILILVPALVTLSIYIAFRLGQRRPVFFQFGKFVVIGVANTAIDFGILNLLIFLTGIEKGHLYSVFKSVSFMIGIINSYLWNKFWTFESTENRWQGGQFLRFISISAVGFGINVATASFVVNLIGPLGGISTRLWANIGACVAIVISVFWNFLGYKFMVFEI
jgi:putative flippase GtrA